MGRPVIRGCGCQAADCARILQKWEQVTDLYQRAAECYGEAGRGQAAAEALSKGARALEDQNPQVRLPARGRGCRRPVGYHVMVAERQCLGLRKETPVS